MSRLSHFLDSQLTDGSEIVSLTHRPPFTSTKIPGSHLLFLLIDPRAVQSAVGKIRSVEKSSDFNGSRTCDIPACGILPQSASLVVMKQLK
jgi:hypothetical protein